MRTFDGLLYDFQSVGEFVVVNSNSVALQVRQQAWGGCASVAIAAASMVGTNRIAVYAHETPPLRINGIPTDTFCSSQSAARSVGLLSVGEGSVTSCSGTLDLTDGGQVMLNTTDSVATYSLKGPNNAPVADIIVRPGGYLDISVSPGSGAMTGLLGSSDGDPTNDLTTRDGRVMPQPITFNQLYRDFGESWRVTQAESLFDYGPGEDTNTYTDRSFPAAPCPPPPEDKRLAAEKACRAAGVTNNDLLQACIFDVTNTGDTGFADSFVGRSEPKATLTVLNDVVDASSPTTTNTDDLRGRGCACRAFGSTTRGFGWLFFLVPAVLLRHRRRMVAS